MNKDAQRFFRRWASDIRAELHRRYRERDIYTYWTPEPATAVTAASAGTRLLS